MTLIREEKKVRKRGLYILKSYVQARGVQEEMAENDLYWVNAVIA